MPDKSKESTPATSSSTEKPRCRVDFSTLCPHCSIAMQPVHAHYQCARCGWRDSCCM
jgi:hypothetical protein